MLGYPLWRETLRSHPQWADTVKAMEEDLAERDADLEAQVQHELRQKHEAREIALSEGEFQQAVTREVIRRSQAHSRQAWDRLTRDVLQKEGLA